LPTVAVCALTSILYVQEGKTFADQPILVEAFDAIAAPFEDGKGLPQLFSVEVMSGLTELSTKLKECEVDEDDPVAEFVEALAGINLALDGHLAKGFFNKLFSDAGENHPPLYFSIGIAWEGRGFEDGGTHGDANNMVVTNSDVIPLAQIFAAFTFTTQRKFWERVIDFERPAMITAGGIEPGIKK
jgi:hypothetical protein